MQLNKKHIQWQNRKNDDVNYKLKKTFIRFEVSLYIYFLRHILHVIIKQILKKKNNNKLTSFLIWFIRYVKR